MVLDELLMTSFIAVFAVSSVSAIKVRSIFESVFEGMYRHRRMVDVVRPILRLWEAGSLIGMYMSIVANIVVTWQ